MRGLGLKDGLIAAVNAEIPRWKALARSVIAGRCDRQSSEPAPNPEREAPVSALTGLNRNAGETRSIRETRSVGEIGSVHPLVGGPGRPRHPPRATRAARPSATRCTTPRARGYGSPEASS